MQVAKALPNIMKPNSVMKKILEKQGFMQKGNSNESSYQTRLQDSSTMQQFLLIIPTENLDNNANIKLELGQAYIEDSNRIPPGVLDAAKSKLKEIADYLKNIETSDQSQDQKDEESLNQIENGNMTNDLDDMKKLGKEMEQMETETELKEKGIQSDPKR